jgi:hypothetical protein
MAVLGEATILDGEWLQRVAPNVTVTLFSVSSCWGFLKTKMRS